MNVTKGFCEFCGTGGPDDCAVCRAFVRADTRLAIRSARRALLRHTPEVQRGRLRLIAREGRLIEDGETNA